jgi:single-stranded DNA-binding protein
MTRAIETAFWGVLGKDPELKTSKAGTPYAGMNVVVTVGKADDGKDIGQWLRVTAFGDAARTIAARARKVDRIYCEGTLTLNTWQGSDGDTKTGLNVSAWKCEHVASIGKSRERKQGDYQADGDAGSYRKPDTGHGTRDFNDEMPF